MLDSEGNRSCEWQFDKNGEPIFSSPRSIDQANNSNIFVVDCTSIDLKGCIIVLGKNGQVIQKYTGNHGPNSGDRDFSPTAIKRTPSDNMVIIDRKNHLLLLLDNTGHYLSCFNTQTIFPDKPYCLAFFDDTTVYIGCTNSIDFEEKAAMYEVEFTHLMKKKKTKNRLDKQGYC